jgi:hypothetical protein
VELVSPADNMKVSMKIISNMKQAVTRGSHMIVLQYGLSNGHCLQKKCFCMPMSVYGFAHVRLFGGS